MTKHKKFMSRCLQLGRLGLGSTYPNPLVGAIVVHNGKIIGEGWHQKAGEAHAEVLAINSVKNQSLLQESTLYVNLEPCAHFGKTPPCSLLIIEKKIPNVVIGMRDPFMEVDGKGIKMLRAAGVEVIIDVLNADSQELNKRFIHYHTKEQAYVILKWAETKNGFFAPKMPNQKWISGKKAKQLSHKWRTEEAGILVGKNTALIDNPQLTPRNWNGKLPVKILIDRKLEVTPNLKIFNSDSELIVFNQQTESVENHVHKIKVSFDDSLIKSILNKLYDIDIQSVIVEGGAKTLQSFIDSGLWNEARIFKSNNAIWNKGIKSPKIEGFLKESIDLETDTLQIFQNQTTA